LDHPLSIPNNIARYRIYLIPTQLPVESYGCSVLVQKIVFSVLQAEIVELPEKSRSSALMQRDRIWEESRFLFEQFLQHQFLDLAGVIAGQGGDGFQAFRDLVTGDLVPAVGFDFV